MEVRLCCISMLCVGMHAVRAMGDEFLADERQEFLAPASVDITSTMVAVPRPATAPKPTNATKKAVSAPGSSPGASPLPGSQGSGDGSDFGNGGGRAKTKERSSDSMEAGVTGGFLCPRGRDLEPREWRQDRYNQVAPCLSYVEGFAGLGAQHEKTKWIYPVVKGEEQWAYQSKDWDTCASGLQQSPIDIVVPQAQIDLALPPFRQNYEMSRLSLLNDGHTIIGRYDPGSFLFVEGSTFMLKEFRFHHRSEHLIDGERFPMELQLVHVDRDLKVVIVSVLLEEGPVGNEFIAAVFANLPLQENTTVTSDEMISVNETLGSLAEYYRYEGGITVPPCTEGVVWLVLKDRMYITAQQIQAFQAAMGFSVMQPENARATQDVGERVVTFKKYIPPRPKVEEVVDWGYAGEDAPQFWGDLSPSFKMCKKGKAQSPIRVPKVNIDPDAPALSFSPQCSAASVTLEHDSIQLRYNGIIGLSLEGANNNSQYHLRQAHVRSPSEHVLDGKRYVAEVQLEFWSKNDSSIKMVSVMMKYGTASPWMGSWLPQLASTRPTASGDGPAPPGGISAPLDSLLPVAEEYYSYTGSLTYPPCTEDVDWYIMQTPTTISRYQQVQVMEALDRIPNNRPVQPLNGREIVFKYSLPL